MNAPAWLPRRIAHFEVEGRVRVEGTTQVFLARDRGPLGFTREVTLRAVPRSEGAPIETLKEQAQVAMRLKHAAIGRTLGIFVEGDFVVLALEGQETATLDDLVEQLSAHGACLPDAAIAHVISTLADALGHAHKSALHCGNLSTSMVLVSDDGRVALSPLAFVSVANDDRSRVRAPEEAAGARATARSDVFRLGVLALQLFAGRDGRSVVERAIALRPPRLGALRPDLPREICAAVDAALSLNPGARTITCAAVAKWVASAFDVAAGRRAMRDAIVPMVELRPEDPPPRASRTMRKAAGMRRRLRRPRTLEGTRPPSENIELDPHVMDLEPVAETDPFADVVLEPPRTPPPRPAIVAPLRAIELAPPRRYEAARPLGWLGRGLAITAAAAAALVLVYRGTADARTLAEPAAATHGPPPAQDSCTDVAGTACNEDMACGVPARSTALVAPAQSLSPDFGWLHVHSRGAVGKVFVAARSWGDPEKTIRVPCGRYYVNVARTDLKATWRGWTNIGQIVTIACGGPVTEVTLDKAPPPPQMCVKTTESNPSATLPALPRNQAKPRASFATK